MFSRGSEPLDISIGGGEGADGAGGGGGSGGGSGGGRGGKKGSGKKGGRGDERMLSNSGNHYTPTHGVMGAAAEYARTMGKSPDRGKD